jgi:hypothetical protein
MASPGSKIRTPSIIARSRANRRLYGAGLTIQISQGSRNAGVSLTSLAPPNAEAALLSGRVGI